MSLEQDYIDLFTYKRKGHMAKYVHMYRPDIYEAIIKQDTYYPFKMESKLLTEMSNIICKDFKDIRHVLELGPGSQTPILSKTIPFLRALESQVGSFTYTAIDSTLEYAEQACALVGEHFRDIKTQPLEADFLRSSTFNNAEKGVSPNGSKLMICFGQPIFANNNDNDIGILLRNIRYFLKQDDYFLFGIDENEDIELLEKAYNTKLGHELLLNIMYFLKSELNLKDFNPERFEHTYKWDSEEKRVELSLKATSKQTIKIREQKLIMDKGQEFNILNSRKPPIKTIKKFLGKENLIINNIIPLEASSENNTFSMVIAQRCLGIDSS